MGPAKQAGFQTFYPTSGHAQARRFLGEPLMGAVIRQVQGGLGRIVTLFRYSIQRWNDCEKGLLNHRKFPSL